MSKLLRIIIIVDRKLSKMKEKAKEREGKRKRKERRG
jgi:hypothetical protein